MTRSPSTEPALPKSGKRKGTRSVSSLTPSQLARKRANDREAQRAIRARTKEHIENLERQLEELKSHQSRDRTVQELIRRNKSLEEEVARLRESLGMPAASPYTAPRTFAPPPAAAASPAMRSQAPAPSPAPKLTRPFAVAYDNNDAHSAGSGTIHSPSMSPMGNSNGNTADYGYAAQQQYIPTTSAPDAWAATTMQSNVSSPSSSGHNGDEYGYIPTSVPTTLMPSSSSLHSMDSIHGGMPPAAPSYMGGHQQHHQQQHHTSPQQHHQQHGADWSMYNMYYPAQMPPKGNDFSNALCMTR